MPGGFPPPVGHPMAPPPRPVRWWAGAVAAAASVVLLVVLVVVVGDGGGRGVLPVGAERPQDGGDAAAAVAFTEAAVALTEAGTFSYRASSRSESPSRWEIGERTVVERELTGDVVLPDARRERVDASDGLSVEHISIGSGGSGRAWERTSAFPDQLAARPWAEVDGSVAAVDRSPGALDVSQLPGWLAAAVGHRARGVDGSGRTVVAATIPPRLVGGLEPEVQLIEVAVELTVGEGGAPYSVALTLFGTEAVVEAAYDISGLGADLDVVPPGPGQLDATPWFNEQDVAEFTGPAPLGLSRVPAGWDFVGAYVTPDAEGGRCPSVSLDYTDLDEPAGAFLWIDVMASGCVEAPEGEEVTAGGLAGAVADEHDGSRWGVVSSAEVDVWFATDLSPADASIVLASLAPLDVTDVPEPLPGIPSSGI